MLKLPHAPKKLYLAVSVSYKYDLPNLLEFVEYHRMVGVQRIYLCNNDEDPAPTLEILKPYIESGLVVHNHTASMWPGIRNRQASAHNFVLGLARTDGVRWLSMLDMDEFLYPVTKDSVTEVLMGYEDVGAIQVNYACFGSSQHTKKQMLQTDSYTWRAFDHWQWNHLTKSVAQTDWISYCDYHHHYRTKHGGWVDEDKMPCDWVHPPKLKYLRINHYLSRSVEDYEEKMKRGNPLGEKRDWRWFAWADRNEVLDDGMRRRFVPELKKRLEDNKLWYLSKGYVKLN